MNPIEMKAGDLKSFDELEKDKKIDKLIERVDALEKLIRHIFGGHVLINGRFVQIP